MKLLCLALIVFCALSAQDPRPPDWWSKTGEPDPRLPDGKSQKEEILKADHKKNLEESAELVKLAEELRGDLEKNTRYVVSIQTLKKTDEIERLVKNIRGRLKRP
jgi:hypothetical protein